MATDPTVELTADTADGVLGKAREGARLFGGIVICLALSLYAAVGAKSLRFFAERY